ncbi:3-isopropylmalate dehydratase small subunit [[Limnothrix rosea] IAM M-220]|uniref:3-isopropylmalate dehydratase small subunit n=1 Tax=[Limnothrix rosea] IAM M-220 TaxID=454133 RepID=UPI000962929C|nr:3-isopropylmalate dehydratase small subunit [[Limnothrix rosea] IAM M-220]OKH18772.1 3-isopropylmalate dehydratase small subunit [[Limnothrix rosea] IAM M-220]
MSSEIKQVSGNGIALRGNDIDTDRIIPARFLKCVTFDGLGEQAFADDRQQMDGRHPFDQGQFQRASILAVNHNFGCGSSREHAPQALLKWGIQAIIGESFAEIFFGNCLANGVPCVTADAATVAAVQGFIEANPETEIIVDLEKSEIVCGDWSKPISLGEGARQALINGTWDSCGQLVTGAAEIAATAQQLPYIAWA